MLTSALLALAFLAGCAPAWAQKSRAKAPKESEAAAARKNLREATMEYKKTLEELLVLHEASAERAAAEVERRKALVAANIATRRELQESEAVLTAARAEVEGTKREMGAADGVLAEAEAAEQLARMPRQRGYVATSAVIRNWGGSGWHLSQVNRVSAFYTGRFGRHLPVSAFGQSGLHNRLGYDHSNAVDVPVHPDSAEGQALMAFLRQANIPFLAFRGAVAGKSTGAHIHIGYPSGRLYR